jgi:hypothetical protein
VTPRLDDIEALARAIDRVVFPGARDRDQHPGRQTASLAMVNYLNESFPRHLPAASRRDRIRRRLLRTLGITGGSPVGRLEDEVNRRLRNLDPRWTQVVGGAAIVLLGVLGVAVWRQRAERGVAALAR